MLTRKHFKAIATIISHGHYGYGACDADYYNAGLFDASNIIANDLAEYFKKDNSNFNREKFLKACNLLLTS